VPFSKVRGAQDQQYMISPDDAGRYTKDSTGSTRKAIQADFDARTATSPNEPLLETLVKSAVHGAGQMFVHPVDSAIAIAKSIPTSPADAPRIAQNMAEGVGQNYIQGGGGAHGAGYAGAKFGGETIGGMGAGIPLGAAGEALAGAASDVASIPKPNVAGQNFTPAHAADFAGAIGPAPAMGRNFIPQDVATEALTPIRNTAARMTQGTPLERSIVQTATQDSYQAGGKTVQVNPMQRINAYESIAQTALNDLEQQHAPALAQNSSVPVDTKPLVSELQGKITKTMDPTDVSAIRNLIMRVQNAKTLGDLNTFRQELNTETAPEYKQSQVQAGRSGVSAEATSDLADSVRNAYYDALEKATGTDYTALKRQEANLITTKEALQNQKSLLAKQEAEFNASTTAKQKLGNIANLIKEPKTTVTQTILKESPATKVATRLQNTLSELPDPPTSTGVPGPPVQGPNQPLLPSQAGGAYPMQGEVPFSPNMTPGEKSAALMQRLRQLQQRGLPANAAPIPLPPPQ
jgi:hypothetical protein